MLTADSSNRSFASIMYGALPLFSTLVYNNAPLKSTKQLLPNKIKFLHEPTAVQTLHSGVYFAIPNLSINEQECLEKAILESMVNNTKAITLNVPNELARKFEKKAKGYPFINELIYSRGVLKYATDVRCLVVTDNTPTDIMLPKLGHICDLDYVAILIQGLIVTARHINNPDSIEATKLDVRKVRESLQYTTKPSTGIFGDHILTFVCDDVEYSTEDVGFVEQLCILMYNFYSPYTEFNKNMTW